MAPDTVMAAFERVLVAVTKHPLSMLLPANYEAIARKALAEGLTAKQAREVQKNLDTPQERKVAKDLLVQVASAADAKTLLTWLVVDVKRALAPTAAPASGPEPMTEGTKETEGTKGAATLISVKWRGFPKIELKYSGTGQWPRKGKGEDGVQAMIKVNHKKVEWLHPGQTVQSLENIFGTKYGQDVAAGQTVLISIADVNGKNDTNTKTLIWQ